MRTGSLAIACLADVPDGPILGRNIEGVLAAITDNTEALIDAVWAWLAEQLL
jgi:hypothetical protein